MSKKRKPLKTSGSKPAHTSQSRLQKASAPPPPNAQKQKKRHPPPPPPPALNPFSSTLSTLLIGEGDFSFAAALQDATAPRVLTATSYDPLSEVLSKYPSTAPAHLETLHAADCSLHHSINATKLHTYSPLRRKGGYDIAAFLFPHVGGLTKDQDRQCRANQALLLGFFTSVKAVLAEKGRVVVGLFEGAVYDAWDVKGLAKREGFVTIASGRFDPALWEGYKHARTLGEIQGGGAWKGEDRRARLYIFCRKGEEGQAVVSSKKRKKQDESSDNEDEDGWN